MRDTANQYPAVVKVQAKTEDMDHIATGFNIAPHGLIVTCRHLVERRKNIIVDFPDSKSYPAAGCDYIPGYDLALLYFDGAGELPALELSQAPIFEMGESITIRNKESETLNGSLAAAEVLY